MNVPRPIAHRCRRAGVADTRGAELPAARRLAPRPQAHKACATGGTQTPALPLHGRSKRGSLAPAPPPTTLCCCCTLWRRLRQWSPRPPRGKPRPPPQPARPRGSRCPQWRSLVRGQPCPARDFPQTCRLNSPCPGGTASEAPGWPIRLAAVPDRLDILEVEIPGKKDPGVLRHLGDEGMAHRRALRLGIDGGKVRVR
jgi:hypothetical protein